MKRARILGRGLPRTTERGSVLLVSLVTVATLAIFGLALLTAGLSGAKSVSHHDDDYRLSSAVESVAILAADELWSGYWASNHAAFSGEPGGIDNFRGYLDSLNIADNGIGGPPSAADGQSLLGTLDIPGAAVGNPELNNVNIDAVQIFRRDVNASTQLYLTVSASTNRGVGIVNPVLNRAVQQVYTVEPTLFEGFEYGILANNVNCIFCHTQVDSVDRFFNFDSNNFGSYDRVKVGTLESLMLRHDMDGKPLTLNDYDADSVLAGTLYTRGSATDHAGVPLTSADWGALSLHGFQFDADGKIVQDQWGNANPTDLSPAGTPFGPLENLYTGYPSDYTQMVDGNLPKSFPPPIPDDGGLDLVTGMPTNAGSGNKTVDDEEFFAASQQALGAITAGFINVSQTASPITTVPQYAQALTAGNLGSIQQSVAGNVILTGTATNPITIDGTVAVDGDLIINGFVKGTGTLLVRGNVYVPTDVQYLDGVDANGYRTFGLAADGVTENKLGITAGGNIMIGDYLRPTSLTPVDPINLGFGWNPPTAGEYVSGDDSAQGGAVAKWSFSLAEISLFNRAEWAKTQPFLPGAGEDNTNPATWTVPNPHYEAGYTPRYYAYGPGDDIPIYNKGNLHYDPVNDNWVGDFEVPLDWDPNLLTYASSAGAVVSNISPTGGWITEEMYKASVDYFTTKRPAGLPLQMDALLYTNNAIFGIVNRQTSMLGQMLVNGALVAADLGLLVPGYPFPSGFGTPFNVPGSNYLIGLRLNYDKRVKDLLNVANPFQVEIKRTLWNPSANML